MNLTIRIPELIIEPFLFFVLTYRRFIYGYAFRKIELTEGKFAIVDPEDYQKISKYQWHLNGSSYACSFEIIDRKRKIFSMHRKIINTGKGLVTDHINRNRLDNRKANLRPVTKSQNACNRKSQPHRSRFKGVQWHKLKNKWQVYITTFGKRIRVGDFADEIEAAKAYDEAAKKYHGQFAMLNFPPVPVKPKTLLSQVINQIAAINAFILDFPQVLRYNIRLAGEIFNRLLEEVVKIFGRKKCPQRVCPKTGKPIGGKFQYPFLKWFFPLTGIGALIWFLIRVIPKPSRAEYPCQKVAFPIASSFIAYILGLGAVTIAMKKARQRLHQAKYVLAAFCVLIAITSAWLTISIHSKNANAVGNFIPPDQPNTPVGVAKGILPGRVAFVRDSAATDWDGISGYYWQDTHTSQAVVDQLMDKVLRALTNEPTDGAAWDSLFRYFNQTHSRGNIGYTPGEKIRIKPNSVNERRHSTADNQADNTPQVVLALLRQLVYKAGVPQQDIIYGDTSRYIPDKIFNKCYTEFPNVVYEETNFYIDSGDDRGTDPHRVAAVTSPEPLVFYSDITDSNGFDNDIRDKLPTSYVNAFYIINLPVFKCHVNPGITLTGKNWYGCLGDRIPHDLLHNTTAERATTTAHYRAQVDLMGSKYLGGKVFLNLIDGIWGNQNKSITPPAKWSMAPFNNDYTSCLFASQDQVAIDSVGLDFLRTQWAYLWNSGADHTVDDYLHEAAQANNPPSGTFYDPDHPLGSPDRVRLQSLGVHEHWNNASNRQYSRNLGTGNGIELVTSATYSCSADIRGDVNGDCEVNYEDIQIIAESWLTPESEARFGDLYNDNEINFKDFAILAADWAKCNVTPSSGCHAP